MNLFVIPSWLPTAAQPVGGIFFVEQAAALARCMPQSQIVLSAWGQGCNALTPRNWMDSWAALRWRLRQRRRSWHSDGNLHHAFTPTLVWSQHLPGGGIGRLVQANLQNLHDMFERVGRADVLHAHVGYPAGLVAARVARATGIPYVLTEHMAPFPFPAFQAGPNRLRADLYEAYEAAAAVIAVSDPLAERMRSFGLRVDEVVPNIVNQQNFIWVPRTEGKPFRFGLLGALGRQKGLDLLLDAIARWRPGPDEVTFRIAGTGSEAAFWQRRADELGIAALIDWCGPLPRSAVPAFMASIDALLMPSRFESFGVVGIEAMACGRPVIAARSGGPESYIQPDNGMLVPVGDVPALATAMREMVARSGRYSPMAIRDYVRERFSAEAVCTRLEQIYRRVAKQNPPANLAGV